MGWLNTIGAGGVILQHSMGNIDAVVGTNSKKSQLELPKGTRKGEELIHETAIREVQEETGLMVTIVAHLPTLKRTFVMKGNHLKHNGVLQNRVETFYVMHPIGGSLTEHDQEFKSVFWANWTWAYRRLRYPSHRRLLKIAVEIFRSTPQVAQHQRNSA